MASAPAPTNMPSRPLPALRRAAALAVLLLTGCVPYLRTDTPTPRPPGLLDAVAALVTGCDEPRPRDPDAGAPESTPGDERRDRGRCATADDRRDGTPTLSPPRPTQKTP